ncbi:MAG TPA: hypothetical protein VFZ83_07065 [Acidimicrobiia bacterium]|nr:hypothetical protein [Acidimicrobiia bacterium]
MSTHVTLGRLERFIESGVVLRFDYTEDVATRVRLVLDAWSSTATREGGPVRFVGVAHATACTIAYVDAPGMARTELRDWLGSLVVALEGVPDADVTVSAVPTGKRLWNALRKSGPSVALGVWGERDGRGGGPPLSAKVVTAALDWVVRHAGDAPVTVRSMNGELRFTDTREAADAARALCEAPGGVDVLAGPADDVAFVDVSRQYACDAVFGRRGDSVGSVLSAIAADLADIGASLAGEVVYGLIRPASRLEDLRGHCNFAHPPERPPPSRPPDRSSASDVRPISLWMRGADNSGPRPNAPDALAERRDQYTLDAQWWQLLGPRHVERLPDPSIAVPLGNDRYEVRFGAIEDWLPSSPRYAETVRSARIALGPLTENPPPRICA